MEDDAESTEVVETPENEDAPKASADIDAIADEIDEESPEPNRAAIEGFKVVREVPTSEPGAAPSNEPTGPVDRFGMSFDPALHHANEDGTPRLFKGKLRRKRKSKVGTAGPPNQATAAGPDQLTPVQQANARLAGRTMADSFIMCAVMIGGDEFQPMKGSTQQGLKIDERGELQSAFANYCEAKGVTDFPPGIALALALTGYIGPRFTMPVTQKRARGAFSWLARKWQTWRKRRAAHIDNRDDGKRQDDTSEVASGETSR